MIEIKKATTITATSKTEDGKEIANLYASISGDGVGTSTSMNIQYQNLYEANKAAVRADKAEFDKYVYGAEDEETADKDVVKDKTK